MTTSRRQFVQVVTGAGIASIAVPHLVLAQSSDPIRIGLLAAKTGPLASGGIDMELALTMFLKEQRAATRARRPQGRSDRRGHRRRSRDRTNQGAGASVEVSSSTA